MLSSQGSANYMPYHVPCGGSVVTPSQLDSPVVQQRPVLPLLAPAKTSSNVSSLQKQTKNERSNIPHEVPRDVEKLRPTSSTNSSCAATDTLRRTLVITRPTTTSLSVDSSNTSNKTRSGRKRKSESLEEKEARQRERVLRNRQAAQRSRDNKRRQFTDLQREYAELTKRNEELEASNNHLSEKVGHLSKRIRTLEQNTGSQPQPSSPAETSSLHRLEVCGSAVSVSLQRTIKTWSLGNWTSPRCQVMNRLSAIFLALLMSIYAPRMVKAQSTNVSRSYVHRKHHLRYVKDRRSLVASDMKHDLRRKYPP
jgi:hypothetical protein